jgi:hypothetical protein
MPAAFERKMGGKLVQFVNIGCELAPIPGDENIALLMARITSIRAIIRADTVLGKTRLWTSVAEIIPIAISWVLRLATVKIVAGTSTVGRAIMPAVYPASRKV